VGDGYEVDVWVSGRNFTQVQERLLCNCSIVVLVIVRRPMSCYVQGQPQWRRKLTIVGLPSCAGMLSLGVEGAFWPTAGVSAVATVGGDIHDQNSLCQVIVGKKACDWSAQGASLQNYLENASG
jgi:hypothetical protein